MVVGYGRVSTLDQNLDLQTDALNAAGCERLFMDKVSGNKKHRPELDKMLDILRPGDKVVIWKLDRLGRVVKHNIDLVETFHKKKIDLQILDFGIDTSTPLGKFFFVVNSAYGELYRNTIIENTNAGLSAARARGRVGGRPKGLSKKAQQIADTVAILYTAKSMSIRTICRQVGISSKTLYNYLDYKGIAHGGTKS